MKRSASARFCSRLLAGLCLAALAACEGGGTAVTKDNAAEVFAKFEAGDIQLTGLYRLTTRQELLGYKALWEEQKWAELAKAVIENGTDKDLYWFYLGEAANGLAGEGCASCRHAAAVYYNLGLARDKTGRDGAYLYECSQGLNIPQDPRCYGFKFPEIFVERLQLLGQ